MKSGCSGVTAESADIFTLVSLALAALVIAVLYGRVKAWDQEHEFVAMHDSDELAAERDKAA